MEKMYSDKLTIRRYFDALGHIHAPYLCLVMCIVDEWKNKIINYYHML
jgi:hypothetical protein